MAIGFLKKPQGGWAIGKGRVEWRSQAPIDQPAFYAPHFFLNDPAPWLCFSEFSNQADFELPAPTGCLHFSEPSAEPFLIRTRQLLEQIGRQELSKAVPVEFATAEIGSSEIPVSKLPSSPQLFSYGFWTESEGMIGATPEILLQVQGSQLKTMALAGTASLEAPSLLDDAKEMHEHRLVIEDIQTCLSPFGDVKIFETQEKFLPTLKHLFTPIEVNLHRPMEPEQLVKTLHPTAALGGFPRDKARAWLQSQPEAGIRRRFGAPFGYVNGDDAVFVVAIRNIQRFDNKIWLGSGCGVVAGSQPEREWEELKLKRQSVRQMLGLS